MESKMKSLIVLLSLVITYAKGIAAQGPCGGLGSKCKTDLFSGADFNVCEKYVRCEYLEDGNKPREQCVQRCSYTAMGCEKQYPVSMWWFRPLRIACGQTAYDCLNRCRLVHDSVGRKRTMFKDFDKFKEQKRDLYEDARRDRRMQTRRPQHDDFNEFYDFAFDKY
ncbi:uncharacterized protein [Clytia hemisphaerica]|uniref:Uncharacterized protein n=1 Tax=Clytia hemisphaerica TaxID=252671 RepID=A0A7M5X0E5_9CNID